MCWFLLRILLRSYTWFQISFYSNIYRNIVSGFEVQDIVLNLWYWPIPTILPIWPIFNIDGCYSWYLYWKPLADTVTIVVSVLLYHGRGTCWTSPIVVLHMNNTCLTEIIKWVTNGGCYHFLYIYRFTNQIFIGHLNFVIIYTFQV